MNHKDFIAPPGERIKLKRYDPQFTGDFKDRAEAEEKLQKDIRRLAKLQDVLYAQNDYALLIIFQAMDAAGKDGTIRHVMSGINPQGCQVFSFKGPSAEDLDHDYLWRCQKCLPERGRIGIFNRSYYEEVLVVRVHPEFLAKQQLPAKVRRKNIWDRRFAEINNFESYLERNGIEVLKFFLNVSKEEQKRRFLDRINRPEKNWKFSVNDAKERGFWDDYMRAYEEMFTHTSTRYAPWHIIPADNKWFARAVVSDIIVSRLKSLKLKYPDVTDAHRQELLKAKAILESD